MNPMKQSDVLSDVLEETKENTSHIEIDTSTIPSQVRQGMVGHNWVQMGRTLVCRSCPCGHSVNIGNRIYMGLDDNGLPILKKFN